MQCNTHINTTWQFIRTENIRIHLTPWTMLYSVSMLCGYIPLWYRKNIHRDKQPRVSVSKDFCTLSCFVCSYVSGTQSIQREWKSWSYSMRCVVFVVFLLSLCGRDISSSVQNQCEYRIALGVFYVITVDLIIIMLSVRLHLWLAGFNWNPLMGYTLVLQMLKHGMWMCICV